MLPLLTPSFLKISSTSSLISSESVIPLYNAICFSFSFSSGVSLNVIFSSFIIVISPYYIYFLFITLLTSLSYIIVKKESGELQPPTISLYLFMKKEDNYKGFQPCTIIYKLLSADFSSLPKKSLKNPIFFRVLTARSPGNKIVYQS